ncbi:MAG: Zn-ribbon domain-containing OB-fold protein [Candidatus Methylomirabilales bacterium]
MALIERIGNVAELNQWPGEIPLGYLYTVGVAGERFFRALKEEGKFLGAYCPPCDLTYVPPRLYCERCFAALDEWRELSGRGTIHAFTIAHIGLDGKKLDSPEIYAFVMLDGAHGGLVHRIGGIEPSRVRIGLEVEPLLKPQKDRTGSITDILYFRPIQR